MHFEQLKAMRTAHCAAVTHTNNALERDRMYKIQQWGSKHCNCDQSWDSV